jgi:TPR repeat protein
MFVMAGLSWVAPHSQAQLTLLPKSGRTSGHRAAARKTTKPPADKAENTAQSSSASANVATNSTVNTNRPIYVRVEPKIDPAKAAAEKEAVLKNAIEFEKGRANNGAAWAQYKLGLRYLTGDGVDKDVTTGRKWLKAAADGGDSQARAKLQLLDSNGPDPVPAKSSAPSSPK